MRQIFLVLCFMVCSVMSAQTFEERFRAFQQSAMDDYESFRDKANERYAEFMRQAWEYYQAAPAVPEPEDDPVPPVPYEDEEQKDDDKEVIIEEVIPTPAPEPQPEPIESIKLESQPEPIEPIKPEPQPEPIDPIKPKPQPEPVANKCKFQYFNTQCEVRIPGKKNNLLAVDRDAIAEGWENLSNGDYEVTLYDCLQLRERLKLCDWAYLLMLYEMSATAYQSANNDAMLLCAWLYCQSGYQMRMALDVDKLHLLYASRHVIYNRSYFNLDGYNYYTLLPVSNNIQICAAAFEKEQAMSLYVTEYPHLQVDKSEVRTLQSERYSQMRVSVQTNRNLVEFYDTYPSSELNNNPLTRWAMYANTPLSREVQQMIYPALRQQIQGLSTREAVERILNFVQTAFVYEYDDKVWGGDRVFFPEETLFYPYADCEDRSILFSRIVRDLLNLPVVLIDYPGHLATAVAFPEIEQGDYISLNGKRFTICDPTYIGAPVGATMPRMDNQTARAILLK